MAQGACTDSNYVHTFGLPGLYAPIADYGLLRAAVEAAEEKGISYMVGNVVSSDVFYGDDPTANDRWKKMGILGVEMEAAGLYMNAARAGKKALALLSCSDHIYKGIELSAEERQTSFRNMMEVALEIS